MFGQGKIAIITDTPSRDVLAIKTLITIVIALMVVLLPTITIHADQLVVTANGHTYYAQLAENKSARSFEQKLRNHPVIIMAHDFEQMKKVGRLPWALPESNRELHTKPGQINLYQGRQLSLYYHHNSWSLTPIAQIHHVTSHQLRQDLGSGKVSIKYSLGK